MKRLHELAGFGLACALLATVVLDEAGQFIMFAFGIAWGRMVIETDALFPQDTKND